MNGIRILLRGFWIERMAFLLICLALPANAQVSVLTQHNDNFRTGTNLSETILNTSDVNVKSFGKLFARSTDGTLSAQVLYVPNLMINGVSHNVIFAATENNSVYAFDADDPSKSQPLWHVNLGTAPPGSDFNIPNQQRVGIMATPVIDSSTRTMYVVAM